MRFGYELAADGKTLVPVPTEQEAIRLMKELRAAGQTLRDIAAELNRRGIADEGRRTMEAHDGKRDSEQGRLKRLYDKLASILRRLPQDRREAFGELLR